MRIIKRLLIYPVLFLILLFVVLYILVNSSYIFEKAAAYFAPQYDFRYDKIEGNAISGITVEGLYYKDEKLAREIKVKIDPITLIKRKITASQLRLYGVNEANLEFMISDLSSDDEENGSSSFPFSIAAKNVRLTMLPFDISGIKFNQADLRVEYIDYARDAFAFGTLKLLAKTSLGRMDIKGAYQGRDLNLSDLYIGNLDTNEIERLAGGEKENVNDGNVSSDENPSVFIPKKLFVHRFKATMLPRSFRGVNISLLTVEGRDLDVDIDHHRWSGDLDLSMVTDIAKARADIHASDRQMEVKSVTIEELDLHKTLTLTENNTYADKPGDDPVSAPAANSSKKDDGSILFLPPVIKIGKLEASMLPTSYDDINLTKVSLKLNAVTLNIPAWIIQNAAVTINAKSDIATITHTGTIHNNTLTSHIEISPEDSLIDHYSLPVRKGALDTIAVDGITDLNSTRLHLTLAARQVLNAKKGDFNIDIDHADISARYIFSTSLIDGHIKADINTPYTKGAKIDANFKKSNKIRYRGTLNALEAKGIDHRFISLLKNISVDFSGDFKTLNATFGSNALKGSFHTKDLKKGGDLHIESKGDIAISDITKLPKALQKSKAKIYADMPIDFNQTFPLHAKTRILSNVANMNADVVYGDTWKLNSVITIPKNTLLRGFDKNIRFDGLGTIKAILKQKGDKLGIELNSKTIKAGAGYHTKNKAAKGDINLAGTHLSLSGDPQRTINISLKSRSIKSLLASVNKIYKIDAPDLVGSISLKAKIKDLKSATLHIRSDKIIIGKNKKTGTVLRNVTLTASGSASGIEIEKYQLETSGLKIYSTKPSKAVFKGDLVKVSPLWINNALKTTGTYDLKTKKGVLSSKASSLKVNHDLADIIAALGIKTHINKDKIAIVGKLHLQGGRIKYDMNKKSFAADSDIIVLQRQKKKNNSFNQNFHIDLTVDSNKPLLYKMKNINIKMVPHIEIRKKYGSSMKIYGKVSLLQGGYYIFEGKRFVLQKSDVRFRGKPTSPILHINIRYKHAGTTVKVKVAGTAADPVLHFSSDPYMSREQILSFILFDTKSGSGTNKADNVTNLLAGNLVKSLFADMGLKLDHLVLSGSGFEVGKKISDKITVIYDQKKRSSIKIRIQNTNNIETDISFGANSRSADIYYKKEF